MTETSYFWDGTALGDAANAPHDADEFTDVFKWILTRNGGYEGVLKSADASYSGSLAVTNPAGTTARLASGLALVDGKLYANNGNIDFDCSTATNYYRIVLRRNDAAQTVRAFALGPSAIVPALTQTPGVTWEIPIATVYNNAGTLQIHDERSYVLRSASDRFFFPAWSGYNLTDSAAIVLGQGTGVVTPMVIPPDALVDRVRVTPFLPLANSKHCYAYGVFQWPEALSSVIGAIITMSAIVFSPSTGVIAYRYGGLLYTHSDYFAGTDTYGVDQTIIRLPSTYSIAVANTRYRIPIYSETISFATNNPQGAMNQYIGAIFERDASIGDDTLSDTLWLTGWEVAVTYLTH